MIKNLGRKVVSATAAVALAATSVVALGGVAANAAVEELTMYAPQAFNVPSNPYEDVAKAFTKKYPQYKIKFIEGSGAADFGGPLLTSLQAGNGADIFKVSPGIGQKDSVVSLAKAGFLADLSDTNAKKSNPAAVALNMGIGAKTYAVGLETTPGTMVANMTLMQADGINRWPLTYAELLKDCGIAKSKGHAMIVWPMGYYPNNNMIALSLGGNTYGKDSNWVAKRASGKVTFATDAGWRKSMDQIVEMYKAGCFLKGGEGANSRDFIDFNYLIQQNSYAMFGPGNVSVMFSGLPFFKGKTLKAVAFPGATAASTTVMADVNYAYAVNKKTKHLKAAKAFINFVASGAGQKVFSSVNGGVGLDGSTSKAEYSLISPLIKAKKTYINPINNFSNAAVTDAMDKGIQGLILGQTTVGKVLSSMDNAWTK